MFAAADPVAAQTLTNEALAHGPDGIDRRERLIAYLAERLLPGRQESSDAERLPEFIERALAGGVVALVGQRLDSAKEKELPAIAADAIQFVLTPYLGAAEAARVARDADPPRPG
jgi:hypothetical protein